MYIVITSATQWNHELSSSFSLWGFSFESPVIQQLCIIGLKGVYDCCEYHAHMKLL